MAERWRDDLAEDLLAAEKAGDGQVIVPVERLRSLLFPAAPQAPERSENPSPSAEQGAMGGHPEDNCDRCGRPFAPWTAPSPLWNTVMRTDGVDLWPVVCPVCFVDVAVEKGVAPRTGWRMYCATPLVSLPTTTPDGRVWDEGSWLWVAPAPPGKPGDGLPEDVRRADWSSIPGNCNVPVDIDLIGTIRCTYLDVPHALHRAHFDSHRDGQVLVVWGKGASPHAVSVEALRLDLPGSLLPAAVPGGGLDREALLAKVEHLTDLADKAARGPWHLVYESCDCGGGYPCGHPQYVYAVTLPVPHRVATPDRPLRDFDYDYTEVSEFTPDTWEFVVAAREELPALLAALAPLLTGPATDGEAAERAPAWIVPSTADPNEHGVLARVNASWWLICPAAATWYRLGVEAGPDSCSDASCEWADVHDAAAELARVLPLGGPR